MVTFNGAAAFLCCGGPSLNEYYLELLHGHGCLIAAVNNAPVAMWRNGRVRPHLWFSVDSPRNFHHDIFLDTACKKYVRRLFCEGDQHVGQGPRDQWKASRNDVRTRHANRWVAWQPATSFPNVELYDAADEFEPETFFSSPLPPWRSGKRCSVLLPAIWLLAHMGVRTINLLGCDLHMEQARPYAWEQAKTKTATDDSNVTLHWLRDRVLPHLISGAHQRGVMIKRLVPGELAAALRGVRETLPFQFAGDLYTTE